MSKRIFVAGATGQIGSFVVQMLKEKKADLVAGVSSADTVIASVPTVVYDFANHASMVNAMRGCDVAFLIAPFVPQMKDWLISAVEAAKKAGVEYVVRSSGIGADAESSVAMAKVHGEIDRAIMQSGMAYAIVRPMTFMQNFATYLQNSIKSQNVFYQPQGDGKTSFVHVRDVAAVAVELLLNQDRHQGKAYNVTGGEALSNAEVAEIISSVTGKKITYVDVPDDAAEKSMRDMGMPEVLIDQTMSLNRITRAGYAAIIATTVKEITGKEPITFRQFAKDNAIVWK